MVKTADKILTSDDESEDERRDEQEPLERRGHYKTMNGKPVMTPEQRKAAKAERDKRYKQRKRTDAAKLRAQQKQAVAKLIMSVPQTGKGAKQAVNKRLSAIESEVR